MSITKHASLQVLSARIATEGGALMRTAHRHAFDYTPRAGFLYVRSRAISSRCNDNYDEFPAEEIKQAYRTFVGKPVFVNHHNDNHRRARGVIRDAVLHEDVNPDGSPDTWVEVLMEVDAIRFPKLAQAILAGEIDRTSMGTDVAFSKCSFCGNKASSPVEYCSHIPKLKGQRIYRRTASGQQEGILVREICYGLGFFENSLLVEEPADPTAYTLGVDDYSGMTRAASKKTAVRPEVGQTVLVSNPAERPVTLRVSGVQGTDRYLMLTGFRVKKGGGIYGGETRIVASPDNITVVPPTTASRKTADVEPVEVAGLCIQAEDTGRILMIQRSFADEDDPARGTWEFPGGHLDDDEHPPTAAIREFTEEVGCEPPHGDIVGSWRSGPIYQGFHMMVPTEGDVDIHCRQEGRATNPDDPHGDDLESVAWWLPADAQKNPALRTEVKSGTDWSLFDPAVKKAAAKTALPGPYPTEHEPRAIQDAQGHWHSACNCGWVGEDYGEDKILAHLKGVLHANQIAWDRGLDTGMQGTPMKKKQSLAFAPAGTRLAKTAAVNYDIRLECGDSVRYVGSQPGQVEVGKTWDCREHGGTKVAEVSGPGTTDKGLGLDRHSMRKSALGEVQAPKEVDTLREEACPVCGEGDTYDGDKCQVCGFVAPPGEFMEPDLEKAKQTDLRQDKNEDKGGGLTCSHCGATFPASPATSVTTDQPKQAVIMDPNKGSDEHEEANPVETGLKAGDPCPDCGEGILVAAPADGAPPTDPAADPAQAGVGDPAADPAAGEFLPAGSASQDDADDADPSDETDDEDGKDGDKPPFVKKKKPTAARSRVSDVEGEDVDMRPALAALAAQQKQIEALKQGLAFVAEVAGISEHPRITSALKVTAVDDNPAFGGGWENMKPVEAPAEAATETTEQAATPQATTDVEAVGSGPLTDVSPDAQTSVTDTGTVLPVQAPEQANVEAPVSGTDTLGKGEVGSPGTNRTETEIVTGTPADNSAAFRDGGFLGSVGQGRVIAGLRLARLRIEAGLEAGDDIELGQAIASSQVSDETIQGEIDVLSKVVTANKTATTRPVARNLVPRSASAAQRTVPSLADATAAPGIEVVGSISADEFGFE